MRHTLIMEMQCEIGRTKEKCVGIKLCGDGNKDLLLSFVSRLVQSVLQKHLSASLYIFLAQNSSLSLKEV